MKTRAAGRMRWHPASLMRRELFSRGVQLRLDVGIVRCPNHYEDGWKRDLEHSHEISVGSGNEQGGLGRRVAPLLNGKWSSPRRRLGRFQPENRTPYLKFSESQRVDAQSRNRLKNAWRLLASDLLYDLPQFWVLDFLEQLA
jgi:hypothetical protein